MSLFSATNQERTYEQLLHNCYFITFWTVIILFFSAIFGQGDYDRGGYYCNLQNPSRKPNRQIVVHKSFKYISNFKTCLTNLPVLITKICLFLDEVVFIDVGKHRQSLIDGLLRKIIQVLANQKQRERNLNGQSEYLEETPEGTLGRKGRKELKAWFDLCTIRLQFPFRFSVGGLLPKPFILTSLYIPSPCVQ